MAVKQFIQMKKQRETSQKQTNKKEQIIQYVWDNIVLSKIYAMDEIGITKKKTLIQKLKVLREYQVE